MIIIHHNDIDGRAAASIAYMKAVSQGIKNIRFIEMDYKDLTPEIPENAEVVIVDFSFKPEEMAKIFAKTDDIVWIDHHVTAKDYGYTLAGLRCFDNKGFSGCELAWQYFNPNKKTPEWVTLIGDYDSWRLVYGESTFNFYEGLKLQNLDPSDGIFNELMNNNIYVEAIVAAGRTAIKYRDNYCQELRNAFGYETVLQGYSAYACNFQRFGSQGFGKMFKKYAICIAYIHDGTKFTVSLYAELVDVSVIAKSYGGGGHKGAAGFTCKELPFGPIKT